MALQTINIDDRSFDQLLEELKQHIPVSQWTDHHPSDPGIMLLELFAWLGEMTLYRMNTVPESHREKFLKLLIDPPEPVTVDVELEFNHSKNISIPAGTRFATDFKDGSRYIFEAITKTIIPAPSASEDQTGTITVKVRSWKRINHEEIGKSDGTANQTFPLKQAPVLLDFVYSSDEYKPNPVVYVDGEEWLLKQFLLTKESQAEGSKHFMVDEFENVIRFGDNKFGSIPPTGAVIKCSYQVLQGPEALIKAGRINEGSDGEIVDTRQLKHILDEIPGLESGETIIIKGNKDAQGGFYFLAKEERFAKGLENYKEPFRLITANDFEYALIKDFNELQQLTRKNDFNELLEVIKKYDIHKLLELKEKNEINILEQLYKEEEIEEAEGKDKFDKLVEKYFDPHHLQGSLYKICRAAAIMNRKFDKEHSKLLELTGHVTILVIPEFKESDLASKNEVQVPEELENKILQFLDKRRLITTHLHIMPAKLKKIEIKMIIRIFKELKDDEMKKTIGNKIKNFMDILKGGFDGKGWPTGKSLYKSHLYHLVEGIDGVDYVKSLTLIPSTSEEYIEIKENELPLLLDPIPNISVERG